MINQINVDGFLVIKFLFKFVLVCSKLDTATRIMLNCSSAQALKFYKKKDKQFAHTNTTSKIIKINKTYKSTHSRSGF